MIGLRRGVVLLSSMLIAGCGEQEPAPRASGALVLELEEDRMGAAAIDALVATEIEVLKSRPIAQRVATELELAHDPAFGADAANVVRRSVRASRRGGSLVIDVGLMGCGASEDPECAARVCNSVIDAYIVQRLESRMGPIARELDWLSMQREQLSEGDARTRVDARIVELDLQRAAITPGARVLEPCSWR